MAGEWPPCRASPRPLAVVLGCLMAACAAGSVCSRQVPRCLPDSPFLLAIIGGVVKAKGTFVMTPLRMRMLEDLQIRNYAPTTVAAYIRNVAEFAKHFGKSPELLRSEQIREYQLYLVKEKRVSLPSYIQAVCALRFLYSNTLHLPDRK